MTAHQFADVLAWCTGLGYGVLMLWAALWLGLRDAFYRVHSRWLRIDRSHYDAVMLTLIGGFKLALLMLFLIPLIALHASGLVQATP